MNPFTVELYRDAYLSGNTASGFVERVVSRAVMPLGSSVAIYATCKQMVGSLSRVLFQLEASDDGSRWYTVGSALQVTGTVSLASAVVVVGAGWVRLRAYVPTGGAPMMQAVFDAGIVFSSQ